jgi:hypothetical protein
VSFVDGKARIATEDECKFSWGGVKGGKRFRCYLCGLKFNPGDYWRWVYSPYYSNFLVCKGCDGPDVLERWKLAIEELKRRFWWIEQ